MLICTGSIYEKRDNGTRDYETRDHGKRHFRNYNKANHDGWNSNEGSPSYGSRCTESVSLSLFGTVA